jgi:hypothetical protein
MIKKLLLQCDIHGLKPYFLINKEKDFKIPLGGLISLCSYLFVVFSIWISGKELINKEHPNLIVNSYNDEIPQALNMTNDNFFMALSIGDAGSINYIDYAVYNITGWKKILTRKPDGSFSVQALPLQFIKCSEKNISILPEVFALVDLKSMHCLKDGEFNISGTYGNKKWEYLDFRVTICDNKTSPIPCRSSDYISNILSAGYFGVLLSDLNIAPSNYLDPFVHFSRDLYTSITYSIHKEYNIYLKKIDVNSDSGWFAEDIHSEYAFNVESDKEMWTFRNNNEFMRLVMRCSPYRQVFNRIYSILQTVAAEIGGIIKFLLVLGYVVNYYFRQLLFASFLADKFFKTNVNVKEIKLQDKDKSIIALNPLTDINKSTSQNFDVSMTLNNYLKPNECEKVITEYQNKRTKMRKSLTIQNKDIFFSLFFCKRGKKLKEKLTFAKRAQQKIEVKFDLVNFIKLHFDFNLIKKIVLN